MSQEPSPGHEETISRFEKLLVGLARARIDFAVVGGLAIILHGYVRLTEDADILVNPDPDNLRRLLEVLVGWGEGWARELSVEDFPRREGSVRVNEDFPLDIFTQLRGRSLEDFRPRLRTFELHGVSLKVLSQEDLIYCKEESWRDKDKLDVLAMKELLARERAKPSP